MKTSAPSRRHLSAIAHAIDRALATPTTSARFPRSITERPSEGLH